MTRPGEDPWGWDDARRCGAKSKSTGERCRRAAILGGTVCPMHGGRAPAVKAAAARRVARERLEGEVGVLLEEFELEAEQAHPVELLLDAVRRAAAMARLWGELVAQLRYPDGVNLKTWTPAVSDPERGALTGPNHLGDGAVHVTVKEYREALKLAGHLSKLALDAGVDERRVRMAEETGRELVAVLRTVEALVVARASAVLSGRDLEDLQADMPALMRQAIEQVVPSAGPRPGVVDVGAVES